MNLLNRANVIQNICEISLLTAATFSPAPVGSMQPFANTHIANEESKKIYFGKSTVSYSQSGKTTASGILFEQTLNIRFPNGDLLQSERIRQYITVKAVKIKTSSGLEFLMGRNDFFQNTSPVISISNTQNLVEVSYKTKSIFPIGLTNGSADHLFGEEIPINFFNL